MVKKGLMIVLSSPSGGGKTTVSKKLLAQDRNIVRSVSCTTRKPRAGEKDGKDYFFISLARFRSMVSRRAFLEWARVHRNRYGTPRHWVEGRLKMGKDVLFVIDVQGGKTLKHKNPQALLIFLRPPSYKVLRQRLRGRQTNSSADMKVRLSDARWEIREGRRYDYQVVNDRLGKAVSEVLKIIRKERRLRH